jgi:hypothetical protein
MSLVEYIGPLLIRFYMDPKLGAKETVYMTRMEKNHNKHWIRAGNYTQQRSNKNIVE